MVKIIETNLRITQSGNIRDHQSRIIEADSWECYCNTIKNYDGNATYFKALSMCGNTINANVKVYDVKYDDFHLSCNMWNNIFKTIHLAYLVTE